MAAPQIFSFRALYLCDHPTCAVVFKIFRGFQPLDFGDHAHASRMVPLRFATYRSLQIVDHRDLARRFGSPGLRPGCAKLPRRSLPPPESTCAHLRRDPQVCGARRCPEPRSYRPGPSRLTRERGPYRPWATSDGAGFWPYRLVFAYDLA